MTTITDSSTNPYPAVSPPPGATANDDWQADDHQPIGWSPVLTVTDHKLYVSTSAVQWADGKVEDGTIEAPLVYVFDLGENAPLNSDQARELASVLLEAATEVDRWAAVSTPAVHPTPPQTPTLAEEPFRRIPSGYLDRRRRRWSSCVLSPSSSGDAKAPSPRLMGARRDDHSCGNEPLPQCPCSGGCDECRTVG
jgi:hypothetical protein